MCWTTSHDPVIDYFAITSHLQVFYSLYNECTDEMKLQQICLCDDRRGQVLQTGCCVCAAAVFSPADCYYSAVDQIRHPEYRKRPVTEHIQCTYDTDRPVTDQLQKTGCREKSVTEKLHENDFRERPVACQKLQPDDRKRAATGQNGPATEGER